MKIAKVTAMVPISALGNVLEYLHINKIDDVDLKFIEGGKGNGAARPPQNEFFRQLLAGKKQGMTQKQVKEVWVGAGYPKASFWAAISHAQEKKIVKKRGEKIFPGGKP